jgi:DNA recombination protein RmuC
MFSLIAVLVSVLLAILIGLFAGFALGARARRSAELATLDATQAAAKAVTEAELARLQNALAEALAAKSAAETQSAAATTRAEERTRALASLQEDRDRIAARLDATVAEKSLIESKQAAEISGLRQALDSERSKTAENLQLLQNAQQALTAQFQALAGQVLDARAKSYSEASRKEIADLLQPLREQLSGFRTKVEQSQIDSAQSVAGLRELIGSLTTMNQKLASEANSLSEALRGSAKAQGDWGEFILLDLLEKTGLRQGDSRALPNRNAMTILGPMSSSTCPGDVTW